MGHPNHLPRVSRITRLQPRRPAFDTNIVENSPPTPKNAPSWMVRVAMFGRPQQPVHGLDDGTSVRRYLGYALGLWGFGLVAFLTVLARVEQIKRFTLFGEEWLPDSEMLTPTSKLKRRSVNSRYADAIEAMYD